MMLQLPKFPNRVGLLDFEDETYSWMFVLGEGSFGTVWKVRRLSDGKVSQLATVEYSFADVCTQGKQRPPIAFNASE